jgi:hypothetical protein
MSGDPRLNTLVCSECGAVSAPDFERGWRGCRADDHGGDEPAALAFYCPRCAGEGFGRPAPRQEESRGRRWRDASKGSTTTFRVALNTTPVSVSDLELASAFHVVEAAGGSGVMVLRGGEAERVRVEFYLEAQNDGHARRLVLEALETLAGETASAQGAWVLAAVDPT